MTSIACHAPCHITERVRYGDTTQTTRCDAHHPCRIHIAIDLAGRPGGQCQGTPVDGQVTAGPSDGVIVVCNSTLIDGVRAGIFTCSPYHATREGIARQQPTAIASRLDGEAQCGIGITIHLGYHIGRQGNGALGDRKVAAVPSNGIVAVGYSALVNGVGAYVLSCGASEAAAECVTRHQASAVASCFNGI